MIVEYFWMMLVVFALLFPEDSLQIAFSIVLQAKLLVLNSILLTRSYCIYRKLAKDLKSLGLDAPPFVFIPIQNR